MIGRSAAEPELLLIVGSDRTDGIVRKDASLHLAGATDLLRLLARGTPWHRLHVRSNMLRQARRPVVDQYRILLNLVTEPEGNEKLLQTMERLLKDAPGRLINRPEAVLRSTRDQVAKRLNGVDGLVVPRVARLRGGQPDRAIQAIRRNGLAWPLLIRRVGTHAGKTVTLVHGEEGARQTLSEPSDMLATEFLDFKSADGLYRKHRVFFIGDKRVLRHMVVSDGWNIHARERVHFMVGHPHLLVEEQALLSRPEGAFSPLVETALAGVRKRIGLDFFGMDFGILRDGRAVLFEANATMNFFPFYPDPRLEYLHKVIAPAHRAFHELLGLPPLAASVPTDAERI